MTYLLGTDEAGYGPKLGPLVIAASLWQVPDWSRNADWYHQLGDLVTRQAARSRTLLPVPLADSKTLYQSGGGLAGLESGLFPAMFAAGLDVDRWDDAWTAIAPDCAEELRSLPWYRQFDVRLPVDADPQLLQQRGRAFRLGLDQRGICLVSIRARVVVAKRFNQLVDRWGGKGALLSHETLQLIRDLVSPLDTESVLVCCDKHGGRDRYGALLQHHFPEQRLEICREGRALSIYRLGPPADGIELRFAAKGETFLPSALASMVAKYLRQLAMMAFNQFWQQHVPGLKPTAGYPADARRFFEEIDAARQRLMIPEHQVWRTR